MSQLGLYHNIQRYSTHDGPGIRSTAFLKGCNLKCAWCANPELIELEPQKMVVGNKEVVIGSEMSAKEMASELMRDETFFAVSGGGVTFSGGEPLLQADFVSETSRYLKEEDIHIAIDTALHVSKEVIQKVLPTTDLFLVDLKAMDNDVHKKYMGVGNQLIVENIKWLSQQDTEIWIRMVLVNNINASMEEIKRRIDFIKELGSAVTRIDLLGYHRLGVGKYERLGKEYSLDDSARLTQSQEEEIKDYIASLELPIHFKEGL